MKLCEAGGSVKVPPAMLCLLYAGTGAMAGLAVDKGQPAAVAG